MKNPLFTLIFALCLTASWGGKADARNVILFVPDGLRAGIVTPDIAPTMSKVRTDGVDFANSHSIFPTFTMPNASALATGHFLADTGVYGNTMYMGFKVAIPEGGAVTPFIEYGPTMRMGFKVRTTPPPQSVTPFIENGPILRDINAEPHYHGNFISPETLLTAARRAGFSTAAIGKLGPAALQDMAALNVTTPVESGGPIVIDDSTGQIDENGEPVGALLPLDIQSDITRLVSEKAVAPARGDNGKSGTCEIPGTRVANEVQQQWFADVASKVILPHFANANKPFFMVYWSRDPDGTQHNHGDSLNELIPGINGQSSKKAIRNADDNLRQLREALETLGLAETTDIIISADHGFSTISKQSKTSGAATQVCGDLRRVLPQGFLALDLAAALDMPAADPDTGYSAITSAPGSLSKRGHAVLGKNPEAPEAVVVANGGSDLVYLPTANNKALAKRIVAFLLTQDYVSGLFVDDKLGEIPGALPMSSFGYANGSAKTIQPSILVNFRSFATDCGFGDILCAATVADTNLMQGQGMHGSFSRADTANFMAAIGPSFKTGYKDAAPSSNADVGATIAQLLGLKVDTNGKLTGRVLTEALKGGTDVPFKAETLRSKPGTGGLETILNMQTVGATRYFDAAGFPGRTVGLNAGPNPGPR